MTNIFLLLVFLSVLDLILECLGYIEILYKMTTIVVNKALVNTKNMTTIVVNMAVKGLSGRGVQTP